MDMNATLIQIEPTIENDKLAVLLGGSKQRRLSRSINTKVTTLEQSLDRLIQPRLHYRIVKARTTDDATVHLEDAVEFRSAKLSRALRDAEKIVCFIGTIGFDVEKEIGRLLDEHKLSEAYILDAMASVAVEDMVEQFHQVMEAKCRNRSKTVTFRFSPGYCDWPITEQKKLFSFGFLPHGAKKVDFGSLWDSSSWIGPPQSLPPLSREKLHRAKNLTAGSCL
jgi:hypothetical protein